MSTAPEEFPNDSTRFDTNSDCTIPAESIPTRQRLNLWRLLGWTLCGAVPGIVVTLCHGYGGPGITLGGTIIGFLAAYERIGPIRLLSLAFFAMVGNVPIAGTVAESAIDATEQPPVRCPSDDFYDWILGGSRLSRPWVIALGLVSGAIIAAVLFVYDSVVVPQGGMGWIGGLREGKAIEAKQWLYIGYCSSSIIGAIVTLGFSPAHRRPLCLAGLVGCLFGLIVGLTQPWTMTALGTWMFFVLALFATQVASLLIAVIEANDRHNASSTD